MSEQIITKLCSKCKSEKPISESYINGLGKIICKSCREKGLEALKKRSIIKFCNKCKTEKPFSEFYPRKDRPGGFRPWCKDCCKKENKTEKHRNAARKYDNSEKGRANEKRYVEENREAIRKLQRSNAKRRNKTPKYIAKRKAYQQTNKYKARLKVCGAVLVGKLPNIKTQTCKCGKQAEHYHHPSYAPEHWLDVVPLCQDCHFAIHFNS